MTIRRWCAGLLLAISATSCVAPRNTELSELAPQEQIRVEGLPLRIRDAENLDHSCQVSVVQGWVESVRGDTLLLSNTERWRHPGAPPCTLPRRVVVILSDSVSPRVLEWQPSGARTAATTIVSVLVALILIVASGDLFR